MVLHTAMKFYHFAHFHPPPHEMTWNVKNADGEKSKLLQFKIFIKDGEGVGVGNYFLHKNK
jgi:hypothetical protein